MSAKANGTKFATKCNQKIISGFTGFAAKRATLFKLSKHITRLQINLNMKKWVLLALVIALAGCCDTIVINNGPLPETALLLVPYQAGETYRFKHSNGLVINFETSRETRDEWDFERPCTEVRYQLNSTRLTPDYPIFNLSFSISNSNAPHIDCYASFGNSWFYIPSDEPQTGVFEMVDSLIISNTTFYNVFMLANYNTPYFGNQGIYSDTLFYNYDFGILKIVMSNNESYEIVP
jgi:hypothetical protein